MIARLDSKLMISFISGLSAGAAIEIVLAELDSLVE
jgi:hypothetical protein